MIARTEQLSHEGFPLTFGVVGVALVPVWAALGAIAALTMDLTIDIERKTEA